MECVTHAHTSIHSFSSRYIPFRRAWLFDSSKLYFHVTEEVRLQQAATDMLHKDRGEKTRKATLVSFCLDASTSNAGSDKVTAFKSSKNLGAIHLTIQPGRSTRRNKGGEQQSWRKTETEKGD